MRKVLLYSLLLIFGLIASQLLPIVLGPSFALAQLVTRWITLACLSIIMIYVGLEFNLDKSRWRSYTWDYFVAFTAATLPWIFCTLYFVFVVEHDPLLEQREIWDASVLLARFAAPTATGVLFSMLIAAGLARSWLFRKIRLLVIFDDLDTILLMVPIKIWIVGFHPELFIILAVAISLLCLGWRWLHAIRIPYDWKWVAVYGVMIVVLCEGLYALSMYAGSQIGVHIEVLLPAFVLGCITAPRKAEKGYLEAVHATLRHQAEKRFNTIVSTLFMFFVGLSMPPFLSDSLAAMAVQSVGDVATALKTHFLEAAVGVTASPLFLGHVLIITILSNIGKMFPAFCYRKEASFRERLALAVGMCPRGEVGAGVIIVALTLLPAIESDLVGVAVLSLALNLACTGVFIWGIKKLVSPEEKPLH